MTIIFVQFINIKKKNNNNKTVSYGVVSFYKL